MGAELRDPRLPRTDLSAAEPAEPSFRCLPLDVSSLSIARVQEELPGEEERHLDASAEIVDHLGHAVYKSHLVAHVFVLASI